MSGYKSPSSKFQRAVDDVNGLLNLEDARTEHKDCRNPSQSTSKALVYHRNILVSCVCQHGKSQALGCCKMVPTCICPAVSDKDGFAFRVFMIQYAQCYRSIEDRCPSSLIPEVSTLAAPCKHTHLVMSNANTYQVVLSFLHFRRNIIG